MAELPIIVLAFANEQEGQRYLRDLPEELRRLQEILKEAERNGLCRIELLPNATLEQVFDVFTRNRERVTILHYAGHADSGQLLLESSAEGGAPAHAAGLATFLGKCQGLQLVFLNGCSTRAQAARLLDAGVTSVITTARAIDDTVAREFAVAFYTELASGQALRAAYELSRARVLAARGDAPRAYYRTRDLGDPATDPASPDPTDDHGFPWEFRAGTELVERWSLPDAAGNPEFGLPTLPVRDLPNCPFRHLAWFTSEHADVFFGRGYAIRELYEQVADSTGPPVLLLYGASGVGKSSLLDAGLLPRLKAGGHEVRYCRRDQRKGLSESLRDVMELKSGSTLLNDGWRAEEARLGKPLVLFLDQVEEVYTRPDAAQPNELDDFMAVLGVALSSRETRPRGKLVLGFRKEWLAETERRLAEAKVPCVKVFLKPLDRRGIIDAILGPARPGRLQRQYRLAIEVGLPEVIAEDLLADVGSALAPTLQVLQSKMWERAGKANPDLPRFDRPLYESLKSDGYLLKDVLDEGLKAVGRWNADVEKSGLALDVLAYHTTDLGTASQHTRVELDRRYAHQSGTLGGLISQLKECYLLIEAETDPDPPTPSTRLAHDLLAPLVQQRFRLSLAPGQRARRLLENRAPEWQDGKTGAVLDETDLATAEAGASGMRALDEDQTGETRLVEASRREHKRRRLIRRFLRFVAAAAAVAICGIGAYAWMERRLSQAATKHSTERLCDRVLAAASERSLRHSVGQRYDSLKEIKEAAEEARENEMPERFLRLRNEAIACLALADLSQAREWADWSTDGVLGGIDGRWKIFTRSQGQGDVSVRRLADNVEIAHLKGDGRRTFTCPSECGRFVALMDSATKHVQLWDLSKTPAKRVPIDDQDRPVNFVAFRPDSQQMALAHPDGFVRVHELPTGKLLKSLRVGQNLVGMAFHPNKPVLAVNCDATTQVLDVETEEALAKFLHPEPVNSVAWHPDGKKLATGCNDRRIYVWVWDVASPKPARVSPGPLRVLKGCKDVGISVHFNHAGDLLVSQEWGVTSRLWDWQMERELLSAPYLIGSRFSLDDRMVGTGINGRRVIISHLADRAFFRVLVRDPSLGEGYYSTCAVSPCGRILAAGMDDGVALWDLKLGTFLEFLRAEGSRAIVFDGAGGLLVNESRGVMRWPLRRDPASPMVLRLGPPQNWANLRANGTGSWHAAETAE